MYCKITSQKEIYLGNINQIRLWWTTNKLEKASGDIHFMYQLDLKNEAFTTALLARLSPSLMFQLLNFNSTIPKTAAIASAVIDGTNASKDHVQIRGILHLLTKKWPEIVLNEVRDGFNRLTEKYKNIANVEMAIKEIQHLFSEDRIDELIVLLEKQDPLVLRQVAARLENTEICDVVNEIIKSLRADSSPSKNTPIF
jgi:hypothetical protein